MSIALVVLQVPSYVTPLASVVPPAAAAFAPPVQLAFGTDTQTIVLAPGATHTFIWPVTNTGDISWLAGTDSATEMRLSVCAQVSTGRSTFRIDCEVGSPHDTWANVWASTTRYANQPRPEIGPGTFATYMWSIKVPDGTPPGEYTFLAAFTLPSGDRGQVYKQTIRVAAGTTFVVNDTEDDDFCDGRCTLRGAIRSSNNNSQPSNTIIFALPSGRTISPASALPAITKPVVIDATTQPDFLDHPIVELNGARAGSASGLVLSAAATVRGLVINQFRKWGINASGSGLIAGNYIGTDLTGTASLGNGTDGDAATGGILLNDSAPSCAGRSIMLFEGFNTSAVDPPSTTPAIAPSFSTGGAPWCVDEVATYHYNTGDGVAPGTIGLASGDTMLGPWAAVGLNSAGAPSPPYINWAATPTTTPLFINGTYTCVDSDPTTWSRNAASAGKGFCRVFGQTTLPTGYRIGAPDYGDGNVISGNLGQGVLIGGVAAASELRQNLIGTTASGTGPLPNGIHGVVVSAVRSTIRGNQISYNSRAGISVGASSGTYWDNIISANAGNGVRMTSGQTNWFDKNLIAGNQSTGVSIGAPNEFVGNSEFTGNVVRDNLGSGFDLRGAAPGEEGETVGVRIDPCSGDDRPCTGGITNNQVEGIRLTRGSNGGIQPPVITRISTTEGLYLEGTGTPRAQIDIYADPGDEGAQSIGTAVVSLDGLWNTYTWTINDADVNTLITALRGGTRFLHATQTDVTGNTSAFSLPLGTLSGVAKCRDTLLPGAKVELFSGAAVAATTFAAAVTAAWRIENAGFGTYTIRYSLGAIVCGTAVTIDGSNVTPPAASPPIDLHNHSWISAARLPLAAPPAACTTGFDCADEHLFKADQSAWFKFKICQGCKAVVTVTKLPANYDLALYKDITLAYKSLTTRQDLVRLGAEFAPDAFSPDAFSPDAFSPDAFSPDAFSPDAFSPDAFSPDAFSPDAFSPDAFSPDAFSPDAYSPDAYSPDAFSPDAFSPDAYSPDAYSPDAFSGGEKVSPDAYSGAQTRSLVAVSAFNGTGSEGIVKNTWENTGDFYIRVRGRNGTFSLAAPFHLEVKLIAGTCGSVAPIGPEITGGLPGVAGPNGGFTSLILMDLGRTPATDAQKTALKTKLGMWTGVLPAPLTPFAARTEIRGAVVDLAADNRIQKAQLQAGNNPACPSAKNVAASEIKRLVDAYRALNGSLQYIVLVGSDYVIPYFRYPDQAGLANERSFYRPVLDSSPTQARQRLGYIANQDRYGARIEVSRGDYTFPIPDLAVGRLAGGITDWMGIIDAYTAVGGVVTPTTGFASGYDFFADAATQIATQIQAGTHSPTTTLIEDQTLPPTHASAWTATQLGAKVLANRYDIQFWGGHFSPASWLAADYETRILASDLANSSIDLRNAIIFSLGCHSGEWDDPDGIPGFTIEPDFPTALARKGATLFAGSIYQYGDTDLIAYGEKLHLEYAKRLNMGPGEAARGGAIPIGKAAIAAKRASIRSTPVRQPIDDKTILGTMLYGLPQLAVNYPQATRLPEDTDTSTVVPVRYTTGPGASAVLGLSSADLSVTSSLTTIPVTLKSATGTLPASYVLGGAGTVAHPGQPILPLELRNVTVANTVLRGVGFRSGTYTDTAGVRALTSAVSTELRVPHTPFESSVLFPVKPYVVDYLDALGDGATRLALTPAQFVGSDTGTLRQLTSTGFRLFYSDSIGTVTPTVGGPMFQPGLAAPPALSNIGAVPGGGEVAFSVSAQGAPYVGIQEVWVTYTAVAGPLFGTWTSLDLHQVRNDAIPPKFDADHPSTRWMETLAVCVPSGPAACLPAGQNAADLRYMVQAANGVGLVTLNNNQGAYFTPGPELQPLTTPKSGTELALDAANPAGGVYREEKAFTAVLTKGGVPVPGQRVTFALGPERASAPTDGSGSATVILGLFQTPGAYDLSVSFLESNDLLGSSRSTPFAIAKQGTSLALAPATFTGSYSPPGTPFVATLRDATGRELREQTVVFVVTGAGGTHVFSDITNFRGRATLVPPLLLAAGTYTVTAHFGDVVTAAGRTVTMTNDRYNGTTATASLTLAANATVAYTGDRIIDTASPLHLRAVVTTTSANKTKAKVLFQVKDASGVIRTISGLAASVLAPIAADGAASATLLDVPVGIFSIETTVVGALSSPTTTRTLIVFDRKVVAGGVGEVVAGTNAIGIPRGRETQFAFITSGSATNAVGALIFRVEDQALTFRSISVNSLTIASSTATLRGTGTLNGTSGYTFKVVAKQVLFARGTFEISIYAPGATTPTYFVSGSLTAGLVIVR